MINLKVILSIIVSSVVFRMSPTAAQLPGCPAVWEAGTYAAGDMVSDDQTIFKCTTYPNSLFCSQEAYKPVASTSAGGAYTLAWETIGPCLGTIAPTTAVVKPGCPSEWVVGTAYVAGSLVSKNGQILKCKSTAAMPTLDKLCNQVGFEPFSTTYGGAWAHAWEVIGPCPTSFQTKCTESIPHDFQTNFQSDNVNSQ